MSRIRLWAERLLPIIVAIVTMTFLMAAHSWVKAAFIDKHLSLPQLYVAVFGWASVQTGALLSVYGIVFTKNDGFIGAIKGSDYMNGFYNYMRHSIILGLVLTITTIPYVVKNAEFEALTHHGYVAVALWFSLFVWAFLSFIRVIWLFNVMARVPEAQFIPA